jgi:hypothetical protein
MKGSGKRRRLQWWMLAPGLACLYSLGIVAFIYKQEFTIDHKAGWVDSERRKLQPVDLPEPHPNAFGTYAEVARLLQKAGVDSDLLSDWSAAVMKGDATTAHALEADARRALELARPALERMHEAAGEDYLSRSGTDLAELYPWLPAARSAARAASAEALRRHLDGDDAGALREVEDVLALGVALPRGGEEIQLMGGVTVIRIGGPWGRYVLADTTASSAELRRHAETVRALRARMPAPSQAVIASGQGLARAVLSSRDISLRQASATARALEAESGEPVDSLHLWATTRNSLDKSVEWIEDRYARLAEAADAPFGDTWWDELVARTPADARVRRDFWARMAASVPLHSRDVWLRAQGELIAEETIACVAAYGAEQGRHPNSLGDLVPEYMPERPPDPWTGDTMLYRLTHDGFTLYAVGANGVDDGGVCDPKDAARVDQVFVPIPALPPAKESTESGAPSPSGRGSG